MAHSLYLSKNCYWQKYNSELQFFDEDKIQQGKKQDVVAEKVAMNNAVISDLFGYET